MTLSELPYHEREALKYISKSLWRGTSFWGCERSMPKLAARGLVEPPPAGGYRITDAGLRVVNG